MSTVSHICVSCENIVRPRQEAIECDSCKRWTHRTCGTGISRDDYRGANRENGNIQYTCLECRSTRQPEISAISDSASQLPDHTVGPLESTRTSSPTHEYGEFSLGLNNNSTFDVSRPERSMEVEENEQFVEDETITRDDVRDIESETSYQIVENGSKRGKRKLVSSDHLFSYFLSTLSGDDMKQLPLCFVIMSRRQKKDYKKVLKHIRKLLPGEIKVSSFC